MEKSPNQITVLIVDDTEIMRDSLRLRLQDLEDMHVIEAANGKTCLDILHNLVNLPDVIVSDHNMPEMTGIEMAAVIDQDPELSNIPIILLSARQAVPGEKLPHSIVESLPKEIDGDWLVATIIRLASREHHRSTA